MGVPANTVQTYAAVGNREDLSDIITTISPVDTLFYSKLKETKGGATAVKHEWLTDALGAAGDNAHLEGADSDTEAVVARTRLYNNCQIQKKVLQVSGTQEAVKKAGVASEVDYQTSKKSKELAKDTEYAALRAVRVDGGAATAAKMRGALNWTTTNLDKAGDAALGADGVVTGGTARPLTEDMLKDVLQNIFTSGGNPDTVLAPPTQKQKISGFASNGNYRTMVESQKLVATVDVYVSDFGTLQVKPHRLMPTDQIFIPDFQYWKKATLRKTFREQLAKTGDSEKYHILQEWTLEANAEAASGRITNLS